MKALKFVSAFLISLIILAPIMSLIGYHEFVPSLAYTPFANWYAFSLGMTLGDPLSLLLAGAAGISAIVFKSKKRGNSDM